MNAWEEQQLAVLVDEGYEQDRRQLRRVKPNPLQVLTATFAFLLALSLCCATCGFAFALLGMAVDAASHWLH